MTNGEINIENQYNFGVQTPGPGVYNLPLEQKPVMLISHALGEGKSIDPEKVGLVRRERKQQIKITWLDGELKKCRTGLFCGNIFVSSGSLFIISSCCRFRPLQLSFTASSVSFDVKTSRLYALLSLSV